MLGTTQQIAIPIVSTGLQTAGAIAAPSIATAVGISTAVAVPIIGAAVAGITLAIVQLTKGCGQTCIITSDEANKIESLMKQNLAIWQGSNKTCAEKQTCVNNFDQLWDALVQFCSSGLYGTAGKNCIGDRQQGACHYQNNGVCWNWFTGYRDPIANDTCSDQAVVNNIASPIIGEVSQVISGTGLDLGTLLALGLVVIGLSSIS